MQLCTCGDGSRPNITIIFGGTGKRIRPDEKAAYHPDVDVYCQTNAWADTEYSVDLINSTVKVLVKDIERFLLFVDNLTSTANR